MPWANEIQEELRWAYAAGLVDGEGCISISRDATSPKRRPGKFRYHVSVQIAMGDPESIQEIAEFWGRTQNRVTCRIPGINKTYRSTMHRVDVSQASEVVRILTRLLPYLRAKRVQAEAALAVAQAILENFGKHDVSDEVYAAWERHYLECKAQKGRNAAEIFPQPAA